MARINGISRPKHEQKEHGRGEGEDDEGGVLDALVSYGLKDGEKQLLQTDADGGQLAGRQAAARDESRQLIAYAGIDDREATQEGKKPSGRGQAAECRFTSCRQIPHLQQY
jgi:hypothetical protein